MTINSYPAPRTVAELRAILDELPDSMPLAYCRYSDICTMDPGRGDTLDLIRALPHRPNDPWLTRAHHSMAPAKIEASRLYLVFPGN
jgi:hypothetical protein